MPDISQNMDGAHMKSHYDDFDEYLIHGGFLSAINEYYSKQTISSATLTTYSDWVRGDVIKRNKKEFFLQEIWPEIATQAQRDGNKTKPEGVWFKFTGMNRNVAVTTCVNLDSLVGDFPCVWHSWLWTCTEVDSCCTLPRFQ